MDSLRINSTTEIPLSELQFRFSRSGGPGGQNVNRVSTKVELIFDLGRSSLGEEKKHRLRVKLKTRLTDDGLLRITSQESRSQWQNRRTALEKFVSLIGLALKRERTRIATTPTKSATEKRIGSKKGRGNLKRTRKVNLQEDL